MTINERRSLPLWKKLIAILISILAFGVQTLLLVFFIIFLASYSGELYKSIVGLIYLAFQLVGVIYVMYILRKNISINYKLTWTFLILLAPIPFCLLYTLNSNEKKLSRRKQRKFNEAFKDIKIDYNEDIPEDYDLLSLIKPLKYNNPNNLVYKNVEYTYFKNILEKHNDMLKEMKNASKYILLEYFIIAEGNLMDSLYEVLEDRSNNGVKIYILYDDVGSKMVAVKKLAKRLAKIENIQICNYQPLGINAKLLFNYRDHRKICVIDGRISYCGGDNLADEYIHYKERYGYWRDNCGKYEGKISLGFTYLFAQMWYLSTKKVITEELKIGDYGETKQPGYFMVFGDGPSTLETPVYDSFMAMIINAKKYLYISTPYLITDEAMISAIVAKAKSGVDVKILMPGIPDKKPVYYMSRSSYSKLLNVGVKIYEVKNCFNHAKNIIADDRYAFEGTANMDYRSLFLHYECGVLIMDNPEIFKMKEDFLEAVENSNEVIKEKWDKRPFIQKLIAFILNIIAPFF